MDSDQIVTPEIVVLRGPKIRAEQSEEVRAEVAGRLECGQTRLILDFRNVDFIDSTFLGFLVMLLKQAVALGGDLKVASLKKPVKATFDMLHLHRIFDIHEDADSAVKAFQ